MDATDDDRPGAPHPSRRWFVAGGLALVAGGGAGVALGFARDDTHAAPRRPAPAALRAAVADERELVLAARSAQRSGTAGAQVAAALVRDHEAHLAALEAALRGYTATEGPQPRVATPPRRSRAELLALERAAARHAAARAAQLTGPVAALLASIAACEATHTELL